VVSGASQQAERCGFDVLPAFFYPDDPSHLVGLAQTLVEADPTVIVAVGRYDDDVALIRALGKLSCPARALAAVAAPMRAFWLDLQRLANACIGPSQWEPGAADVPDVGPASTLFVERFRQRFGRVPDYPAAQAYAAGLILQRCVGLAGSCADADLRASAETLHCRTLYGDFRLDPLSGVQIGHETVLVQWQAGDKKVVWPAQVAEAGLIA
jgi:ABC-type branched-subunit amino acid transport system substrate-binding protein